MIELHFIGGSSLYINIYEITYVAANDQGAWICLDNGVKLQVKESYETVKNLIDNAE